MNGRRAVLACAAWAMLLCGAAASAQNAIDASRLPPEAFLAMPKYRDVSLSPDGRYLAAVVPQNERGNLALIDVEKRSAKMLTGMQRHDVASYRWIGDRMLLVTSYDLSEASGILQRGESVLVDVEGNVVRDMRKSGSRGGSRIIAAIDRAGEDLVIENRDRTIEGLDAYRYNPRTSQKTLLTFRSPGFVQQFVADRAGQVRVAVVEPKGGRLSSLWYRRTNDDEWKKLRETAIDAVEIRPLAFAYDDATLYVSARTGSDGRFAIHEFDPETNTLGKEIANSSLVDLESLRFDRVSKKLVGVGDGSRVGIKWIDPEFDRLQKSIDAALPDTRNRFTWSTYDTSQVLIVADSETRAPVFLLLDRKTHRMEEVAVAYPQLADVAIGARKRVSYAARDGLTIPAYLTLPRGPAKGLPLVVDIHGGPYVPGGHFGYDCEAAFLASRGYAVLQPDFRGTLGYGQAFYRKGWREWGYAMQDDVTDGVKWLIANGTVDPDRVCLFGASYGGYATLWGLEKEPDMFRCGVAFVAVADLELMFTVNWSDFMRGDDDGGATAWLIEHIGDPQKDRERLRAVSPLYHADRIKANLLLAYGASDVRVPITHGNQMRDALDRYKKSYEWVVYPNEGHGFTKAENRYDFYRRVDAFLAKNLAPRAAAASVSSPSTPSDSTASSR